MQIFHKSIPRLTWEGRSNPDSGGMFPGDCSRMLVEEIGLSIGDGGGNLLIHGDSLIALPALHATMAGKVKCAYLDPPYNTGVALDLYKDAMDHARWLQMMEDVLRGTIPLLRPDGVVAVQIGDGEMAYLKVLMDEIFGRSNCIGQVALRMSHCAGMKRNAMTRRMVKNTEYLLIYYHQERPVLRPIFQPCTEYPVNYYQYITEMPLSATGNGNDDPAAGEGSVRPGRFVPLVEVVADRMAHLLERHALPPGNRSLHLLYEREVEFRDFVHQYADRIGRKDANVPPGAVAAHGTRLAPDQLMVLHGAERSWLVGRTTRGALFQMYTLADRVQEACPAALEPVSRKGAEQGVGLTELLGDWWDGFWRDMSRVDREGGVRMKCSKKPERLVAMVLDLLTGPGEVVLDPFLGSGTTAAVAAKMGRAWIGIEQGEHCITHAYPRLQRVLGGEDATGVTRRYGWSGGGGFSFLRLRRGDSA